jgi:hypothetical protein
MSGFVWQPRSQAFIKKHSLKKLSAKSFCQKALIKTLEIKHGKKLEELT